MTFRGAIKAERVVENRADTDGSLHITSRRITVRNLTMNGAVIILLLALVASPVINATTLFPQLLHPRLRFPGVYPRAYPGVVQPGLRQVFPTGIYREDLYDYPYGQRSVLGGHYRPSVLPQYQPIYADPRDSYIYDVFDTQASRRAGVGPASAATAAAAPVNALPVRV